MRQRFVPAHHVGAIVRLAQQQARASDVYVGAAPRRLPNGRKEAVEKVWTLWADCDTAESVALLAEFQPEPRYVVTTGSGENVQAWWPLKSWVTPETAERLNRRLAFALKSDMVTTDCSRILRPPGTFNHKHKPSRPVRVIAEVPGFIDPQLIYTLPAPTATATAPAAEPREDTVDLLLSVAPPAYVRALTGQVPDRTGKIRCPFHKGGKERTPSLHVYPSAREGWRCFGCNRGGSVYDFAAEMWGMGTRGEDFKALRTRLKEAISA